MSGSVERGGVRWLKPPESTSGRRVGRGGGRFLRKGHTDPDTQYEQARMQEHHEDKKQRILTRLLFGHLYGCLFFCLFCIVGED